MSDYRNAGRKKGSLNKLSKEKTTTQRIYKKTYDLINENKNDLDFKDFLDLSVKIGIDEIKKRTITSSAENDV